MALEKSVKKTNKVVSGGKGKKQIKFSTTKVSYADIAKETLKISPKSKNKNENADNKKNSKAKPVIISTKKKFSLPKIPRKGILAILYTVVFVVVFSLIDLFFQYLNNDYSAAVVNGVRIPRSEYTKLVDEKYGAVVAQGLIDEEIVRQLIRERNIVITNETVEKKYEQIKTDPNFASEEELYLYIEQNHGSIDEFKEQIKYSLEWMKLVEPYIIYEDADIVTYFDEAKETVYTRFADKSFDDLDEESKQRITDDFLLQTSYEQSQVIIPDMIDQYKASHRIQNNITAQPEYKLFGFTSNLFDSLTKTATSTPASE